MDFGCGIFGCGTRVWADNDENETVNPATHAERTRRRILLPGGPEVGIMACPAIPAHEECGFLCYAPHVLIGLADAPVIPVMGPPDCS
jgi:hypothetical protein